MVNEDKVRIMTQIALDETNNSRDGIDESGYYRSDYIRSHTISVIWNLSVAYVLILFLVAMYRADYIFVNVVKLDYAKIGMAILGIYVILIMISVFFSYFHFLKKYIIVQEHLREYYTKLLQLEEFYAKSKEESKDDAVTGA